MWKLVLKQDSANGQFFSDLTDAEYHVEDEGEDADLYSIMNELDDYYIDGVLTFKWVWPDLASSYNSEFKVRRYQLLVRTIVPTNTLPIH